MSVAPPQRPHAKPRPSPGEVRIDLHCHSRHSTTRGRWLRGELGLNESITPPELVYRLAKARGMTHVTLTDNDSIEGALRLAHREDFFIGEEVTAFFPAEALHVHVLVWDIDEKQHAEIGELRFDVFELVEYLRRNGIAHGLAHPFSFVTGGLRAEQLEALFTLFDVWEVRNGLSCIAENELAEELVAGSEGLRARILGGETGPPASIGACAGSDDHCALDVGTTYTAIPADAAADGPLAALMRGLGKPCGAHGSTAKLAHNGVALIASEGIDPSSLTRRLLEQAASSALTWRVLARPSGRRLAERAATLATAVPLGRRGSRNSPIVATLRDVRGDVLNGDSLTGGIRHESLQAQVELSWQASVRDQLGRAVPLDGRGAPGDRKWVTDLAETQTLLAPYLLAAGFHARQRRHAAEAQRRLAARGLAPDRPRKAARRVAMFTDTYDEVNGVATVLRELVAHATAHDWPFAVVSAGTSRRSEPGREVFAAVDARTMAVYPGFPMAVLPILEVLRWCEDADVEIIHAATPGPVGMVAWLIASSLDLPLIGTYHTDLPNLGFSLTGDHVLQEGLWAYVRLFYDQCAVVLCPSEATRRDLAEHRVKSRLRPFPQGVDCTRFSPERRDASLHRRLGGGRSVLLWVGRLSPEKGLDALAAIYRELRAQRDDVCLVVVGEGPGRERLLRLAPDAVFLGVKTGHELAAIFASADIFLFPGQAETFGQTVLEAAASGLPAVVTAGTGTEEAMVRDVTALTVAPGDVNGFVAAVERLLDDPELNERMRAAAREHALAHGWPASFARLERVYRSITA